MVRVSAHTDPMPQSEKSPNGAWPNTYTGYSTGCAAVWAVILFVAQRRADVEARKPIQLFCAAWWSGWTSATIARVGYPPPQKLGPKADTTLKITSVVLIAAGLGSVIRFLWAASNSARKPVRLSRRRAG
jgi:hypothetical protein